MKRIVTLLLSCGAMAAAQTATTPIPAPQYVQQEVQANPAAITIQDGRVAEAPNLADMLALCNAPTAMLFDSNRSGRVDSLRVYGVSRISASVWRLRGPAAIGAASTKAELAAEEYAVKYLQGAAIAATTLSSEGEQTSESAAEATAGDTSVRTSNALVEVNSSLLQVKQRNVAGIIRYGRVTGTRTVSIGDGNMCIVVRYELPLNQTAAPGSGAGPTVPGLPAQGAPAGTLPGYAPLPPGRTGDF
ncbi:hypothetical protein [Deinococcus sp. JMULE3]|uniref:hypothetical protein n=1 Tax=Deinococcus sp. JMULE3 TaxID=2518341 RepID=UPI0015763AA7|nr:hypothetical protein [Deinococcus sp. JMULE3]NTY02604.1 hypothetical protein [Deinococcus sp. JMULE3]